MNRLLWLMTLLFLLCQSPVLAFQQISLERPGEKEFVRDLAELLTPQDRDAIIADCGKLLKDKATPIIVVTIKDMKSHGGANMRIETFARLLFDQWEIGNAELDGVVWNTGILLLISRNDRKARIELGGGWKRDYDQQSREIMDQMILPEFRKENYSKGIREGVKGLIAMSSGIRLPVQSGQTGQSAPSGSPRGDGGSSPILTMILVGLVIFTVVSLIRRGNGGWAWLLWGGVFSILGMILVSMLTNHNRRSPWNSGGGSFGGGSFGGGFSGGGGASGSW